MQLMLASVSYKVTTLMPEIFMGKSAFPCSHIWMCKTLGGSCSVEGSSCKAYKFAHSHSFPNSSSEELSRKKCLIPSSVKATSSSSVTLTTSSSF